MKGFLEENATEVKNMVMGEWDMDTALEVAKEEGIEEGWEDVLELVRQGYSAEMIERKLQNRKGNATTTA
jgi:ribosomal protein L6P/L9E